MVVVKGKRIVNIDSHLLTVYSVRVEIQERIVERLRSETEASVKLTTRGWTKFLSVGFLEACILCTQICVSLQAS